MQTRGVFVIECIITHTIMVIINLIIILITIIIIVVVVVFVFLLLITTTICFEMLLVSDEAGVPGDYAGTLVLLIKEDYCHFGRTIFLNARAGRKYGTKKHKKYYL